MIAVEQEISVEHVQPVIAFIAEEEEEIIDVPVVITDLRTIFRESGNTTPTGGILKARSSYTSGSVTPNSEFGDEQRRMIGKRVRFL